MMLESGRYTSKTRIYQNAETHDPTKCQDQAIINNNNNNLAFCPKLLSGLEKIYIEYA
jgi:hypothetical protein